MANITISDENHIPDILQALEEIKTKTVEIGIFGEGTSGQNERGETIEVDSFMVKIAGVHEFGMTIRPKSKKFLAIPTPLANGRKPREIPDLTFIETRDGKSGLLVKEEKQKGRSKKGDRMDIYFILVRSVDIPERSFIRSAYDESESDLARVIETQIINVLNRKITVHQMYERIGIFIVKRITRQMRDVKTPPNAPITQANKKGVDNPLIDTGRMRQHVSWRVVDV